MKALFCALALTGLAVSASAEERVIKTVNGATMKVEITNVEPDGLTVSHKDGITKISFEDLSKDVREEFSYDPVKARAYVLQVHQAREARRAYEADVSKRIVVTPAAATPPPAVVRAPQSSGPTLMEAGPGGKTKTGLSIGKLGGGLNK